MLLPFSKQLALSARKRPVTADQTSYFLLKNLILRNKSSPSSPRVSSRKKIADKVPRDAEVGQMEITQDFQGAFRFPLFFLPHRQSSSNIVWYVTMSQCTTPERLYYCSILKENNAFQFHCSAPQETYIYNTISLDYKLFVSEVDSESHWWVTKINLLPWLGTKGRRMHTSFENSMELPRASLV